MTEVAMLTRVGANSNSNSNIHTKERSKCSKNIMKKSHYCGTLT